MPRQDVLSDLELRSLLALVRLDDDAYGVRIHEDIVERTGRGVSVAAVYAALRRLEADGLISSSISEPVPERGGRARKHFQLEVAGAHALAEARRVHDRLWADVDLGAWLEPS